MGDPGERLLAWIRLLADEVGPRRPTSAGERRAAELVRTRLAERGLEAEIEPFRGYSTFAGPFGVILALAVAPALLPRRRRALRALLSSASVAGLLSEGGLTRTPLSDALSRRPSQNVVAAIEPAGEARRTVCLVCHLDTSRSGLLFDPRFVRHLTPWLNAQSAACVVQGAEPVLSRSPVGRGVLAAARAVLAVGLGLLIERELRGEDVPGASDDASGVAVVAELALELAASPLERTRVVALMTGCEESGLLGARHFLRNRDTKGWLFVNVDNVGGPATLRYTRREGLARKWDCDPGLVAIADRIATERPQLGFEPSEGPIGLTYDATPVLAGGGRAITLVAGDDGVIPNYHWPTDTAENLDPACVARAHAVARELVVAVDRGEAD
ncbi:MAG: M28 family peptidase [Actinobacteria bacterium]|nr:M28 family peptidase [Actinomycetota bacterium]